MAEKGKDKKATPTPSAYDAWLAQRAQWALSSWLGIEVKKTKEEVVRDYAMRWKDKALKKKGGEAAPEAAAKPTGLKRFSTLSKLDASDWTYASAWQATPSYYMKRTQNRPEGPALDLNALDEPELSEIYAETKAPPQAAAGSQKQRRPPAPKFKQQKSLEEIEFPPVHKPAFIWTVTILETLLFLYSLYVYGGVAPFNQNVFIGPDTQTLVDMGAKYGPLMLPPRNERYRFVSAIFLHAGFIHLGMNLSFQLNVGKELEASYGAWRVMAVYMIAGVGGNLVSCLFVPEMIQVGCSGALYGLLGCIVIDLLQNWKLLRHLNVNPWTLLAKQFMTICFSLGIGMLPMIDNFAHSGGFVFGGLAGIVFFPTINFGKWSAIWKLGLAISAALLIAGMFSTGFEMFYNNKDASGWCTWCLQLDCIDAFFDCNIQNAATPIAAPSPT
eukprot:TRINITY_DN779_c0_g1_i2.p1 TRINITY_DN779_c0_g1~~TRINITY_DN779_c0_g1_i2.p1  ORF type:complete len:442 (-),score=94.17 TRINITY_DN779_c0_g1_i2:80-1405(-)